MIWSSCSPCPSGPIWRCLAAGLSRPGFGPRRRGCRTSLARIAAMPGMAASRLPQISAEVADRAHLPDLDSSRFAALSRFQCDSSGSGCGDRGKDVRDVITVPVLDAGVGVEVALGQSGVWRYFLV